MVRAIIGSSNLSNILENSRQYEADYLFGEGNASKEVDSFIDRLLADASQPFEDLEIKLIEPDNNLLHDQIDVKKISEKEIAFAKQNVSNLRFKIPLKGDGSPKSGLNPFFGKGRENPQGLIIPRPWYEVELIVPKAITQQEGYPQKDKNSSFSVITDDGWSFLCKVSGANSKNFRSYNDLKILGKWIKGRLENAGALKPGELATDKTLEKYGRTDMDFIKIKNSDMWYLDFGITYA